MSTTKERALAFVAHKGLKMKEFEELAGLSSGYITSMRKGFGEGKLNNVLTAFPDLNRDWLVYGEGSMLKSESATRRVESDVRPILVGGKEWADVPLVPFSARAGALCGFGDPQWLEDKQTCRCLWIVALKVIMSFLK